MVRPGGCDALLGDARVGRRDRLLEHERLSVLADERVEARRRHRDAIQLLTGDADGTHGGLLVAHRPARGDGAGIRRGARASGWRLPPLVLSRWPWRFSTFSVAELLESTSVTARPTSHCRIATVARCGSGTTMARRRSSSTSTRRTTRRGAPRKPAPSATSTRI